MKYALQIFSEQHNILDIANASLSVINFAVKDVREELSDAGAGELRVELRELDSEGEPQRSLLSMAADSETVGDMLKTRLARLRKAEKEQAPAGAVSSENNE